MCQDCHDPDTYADDDLGYADDDEDWGDDGYEAEPDEEDWPGDRDDLDDYDEMRDYRPEPPARGTTTRRCWSGSGGGCVTSGAGSVPAAGYRSTTTNHPFSSEERGEGIVRPRVHEDPDGLEAR